MILRPSRLWVLIFFAAGCAAAEGLLGGKLEVPPEFDQKIILDVSDRAGSHQAQRSGYDSGDLQSFHTQHTLPITIEGAFKEMFGQVELLEGDAKVDMAAPDVPAIFEVRIIDIANDIYTEASTYRGEITLAVAMKSPRDQIFWQKAFRGSGYVQVDPQFSTGLGPQDAVVDALRDAIDQMQKAIIASPEVRAQLRHYMEIDQARRAREVKV